MANASEKPERAEAAVRPRLPSLTPRVRRIVWCVWFALLMGAPYDPMGGGTFGGFGVAFGPVSLSPIFAWVALGMLLGIWFGVHPRICAIISSSDGIRDVAIVSGLALCLLFAGTAWLNAILATCLAVPNGLLEWALFAQSPFLSWLHEMLGLLFDNCKLIALIASFLCGASLMPGGMSQTRRGRPDNDAPRFVLGQNGVVCLVIIMFALGMIQPLAWMLLMPHSPFPQPNVFVDAVSSDWFWNSGSFVSVMLAGSPTILMIGVTNSVTSHDCEICKLGLPSVSSLCCGILAFRIVSRLAPDVFRTPFWLAVAALVAYILLLVVAALALRRGRANHAVHSDQGISVLDDARGVQAPERRLIVESMSPSGRLYLTGKGLTEREVMATGARLVGMTSSQAGSALGISEHTVREYWRRSKVKLGVDDLAEVAPMVMMRSLEDSTELTGDSDASGASSKEGPFHSTRGKGSMIALLSGMAFCMVLMLLPFGESVRVWSDVWTTSFGIGLGIMGTWLTARWRTTELAYSSRLLLISVALVALSVSLALLVDEGLVPQTMTDGVVRKFLVLAGTALFTMTAFLSIDWLMPWLDGVEGSVVTSAAGVSACCALVCGVLGVRVIGLLVAMCAIVVAAIVLAVHHGDLSARRSRCHATPPLDFAWLLAVALFMWMWGETWRAQRYDSPLSLLQWGVLALFLAACIGAVVARGLDVRKLIALPVVLLVSWIVADLARSLVVVALLFVLVCRLDQGCEHVERVISPENCLYDGLLAGAFGIMSGTLLTNQLGTVIATGRALPIAGSLAVFRALLVIVMVLDVIVCVVSLTKGEALSLGLTDRERMEVLLLGKGLSAEQSTIVMMLARGASVTETSIRLNYSRSTVTRVRAEAYRALGVSSRRELSEALRSLLAQVSL